MIKGLKYILAIIAFGFSFCALGQNEANYSSLVQNLGFANPSFYSINSSLGVNIITRSQWTNINGAPFNGGFDVRKGFSRIGVGFGIKGNVESIGARVNSLVGLNVNTGVQLGLDQYLMIGLYGGMEMWRYDISEEILNPGDVIEPGNKNKPLVSAGLNYSYRDFVIGASFRTAFRSIKQAGDDEIWTYYAHAQYTQKINGDWNIKPVLLYSYSGQFGSRFDAAAIAGFRNTVNFGAVYRAGKALAALVEYRIYKTFIISYSYDFNISPVTKGFGGSHEFALKWNVDVFSKPCWCEPGQY